MNLTHEGLSLWYGTPDAPAPIDEVAPRSGPSLVVGVRPANPTNAVLVRYRVDGGPVQAVPGRELRTDYDRDAQYFAVRFPAFPTGDAIEYSPMLTCGGRQVPPPHAANRFPSKFRLAAREAGPPVRRAGASTPPQQQRFAAGLGFVATVAVQFSETQFVGETAAGMRVNFFVGEGTVQGRGFKGNVTPGSVRPDAHPAGWHGRRPHPRSLCHRGRRGARRRVRWVRRLRSRWLQQYVILPVEQEQEKKKTATNQ